MAWPVCNSTLEDQKITEQPVWNGYTFHRIGLWISAIFGLIAIVVSLFLMLQHCTHYSRPHQQRHILRILFMVPVYAAVSFLSYLYYTHSVYFEVIRDCYEAFAIASFFSLLCSYIADDLHMQKEYFRGITPKPWVWPVSTAKKCCGGDRGPWRTPRSGLTWFNVVFVSIFQYCFIRVFMTIVAVVTQVFNRYCLESLNPAFSHIWVMGIESIAVSIAMFCLIQFYIQVKNDIAEHKPLQKVLAIKLVIFLSFWQTIILSLLTSAGAINANDQFQTPDIKVGIPAMLLCIEMALFSIFHLVAFNYRPYVIGSKNMLSESVPGETSSTLHYKGGWFGLKAMADAFNPWDMIKAIGRSAKWLFRDRKNRHQDISYSLSRKTTQGSDAMPERSNNPFNAQTAYGGAVKPNVHRPSHYGGGETSEGENLLNHSQSMPVSRPYQRTDVSPYRTNERNEYEMNEGDIGVAVSNFDGEPQPPYTRANYTDSQQDVGFIPPYPDPEQEHQQRSRNDRISMPPSNNRPPPGQGNML